MSAAAAAPPIAPSAVFELQLTLPGTVTAGAVELAGSPLAELLSAFADALADGPALALARRAGADTLNVTVLPALTHPENGPGTTISALIALTGVTLPGEHDQPASPFGAACAQLARETMRVACWTLAGSALSDELIVTVFRG